VEIVNRRARYDYEIENNYEVGIVLTGTEVKSIREGKVNLKDSYVIIRNEELFLLNTHISAYSKGNIFNHEENRTRKLLMHKKDIKKLKSKIELTGYTLVPLKMYFKNGRVKLSVALACGKKNYDKKESIKVRDIERENAKEYKFR